MQNIIRIDLGGVNSYLVEKNQKYMLVDTGGHLFIDKTYHDRRDILENALDQHGVTKDNLEMILLTHGDCDHVFNGAYFKKKYEAMVAIHSEDADMIRNPKWDDYKMNCKYESKVFQIGMKLLGNKIEKLMRRVFTEFVSYEPDVILKDGINLEKYGFEGIVYHTPGHTPGSICILDQEGNLVCGDMFANNRKPETAVNAMDFEVLKKQVKKIMQLDVKMVYPGHGEPFDAMQILM